MKSSFIKQHRALLLVGVLLSVGAGCATTNTPASTTSTVQTSVTSTTSASSTVSAPVASSTMEVTYFIPKDIVGYMSAEEAYSQTLQGKDPALTVVYVKSTTTTKSTNDPMFVAAQAATVLLPAGGGPPHANVIYLKVKAATAYVMFDIDYNGWAGVSAVKAAIEPVVTKNLKQFPGITRVLFMPAPGDNRDAIYQVKN